MSTALLLSMVWPGAGTLYAGGGLGLPIMLLWPTIAFGGILLLARVGLFALPGFFMWILAILVLWILGMVHASKAVHAANGTASINSLSLRTGSTLSSQILRRFTG